ncbi:MAG: nuclear transport factor 2 family protein [Bacteroidia bacterium]|nr:nuclear transport factor 2 family protein [Bacteroidia bacterium]
MIQSQAQTSDLQLIEKTINHYFDGMINHNASSIEKAFHPGASMKWMAEKYMDVNAVEALSDYVNSNDPVKTKTRITSINIVGDAANAQLELEYESFYFIDFMHLMKIEGEWKIVSKTYTTVQKDF